MGLFESGTSQSVGYSLKNQCKLSRIGLKNTEGRLKDRCTDRCSLSLRLIGKSIENLSRSRTNFCP